MRGNKRTFPNFHFAFMISMNSNSFHHKTLERRWHDFFHLFKWQGVLKIFEFHLKIFPILKLYATQWFSREKIKWLLQIIWNMSWEFQRIKFKAPLNLFSIWNRSSCIFYFLAFWSILEISRNSRTLGESWRFRYFHIWEFSRIEKRIIWFIYFIFNYFSVIKNIREGIIWLSQI